MNGLPYLLKKIFSEIFLLNLLLRFASSTLCDFVTFVFLSSILRPPDIYWRKYLLPFLNILEGLDEGNWDSAALDL